MTKRAERKDVMLAKPLDIRRLDHWPRPFIAQPKVEGFRCPIIVERTKYGETMCSLRSSSASPVVSVPHIGPQIIDLMKRNVFPGDRFEIDGELYRHGVPFSGPKNSISSICSRTVNLHPDFETMEYHAFDIVNELPQFDRLAQLKILSQAFRGSIKHVDHVLLNTVDDVARYLTDCMAEGYEGIILRHPKEYYIPKKVSSVMKFKPRKKDVYLIVGINEEISKDGFAKGTLGSFICEKDSQRFSVGSGPVLTKPGRQELWDNQDILTSGDYYAVVKYQYLTPGRDVPYSPVIIEVKSASEIEEEDK